MLLLWTRREARRYLFLLDKRLDGAHVKASMPTRSCKYRIQWLAADFNGDYVLLFAKKKPIQG